VVAEELGRVLRLEKERVEGGYQIGQQLIEEQVEGLGFLGGELVDLTEEPVDDRRRLEA
jgi:hypothetical protein